MKNLYFILAVILILSMMLTPLIAVNHTSGTVKTTEKSQEQSSPKAKKADTDVFLVYDTETKKISKLPAEKYICGVVAAEMPASFQPEALKAQAVAAYTFACNKREKRKQNHSKYDITVGKGAAQGYIPADKLSEKWGEHTAEYTEKIALAVKEVLGYTVTYEGKPIFAAYHAMSGGKTESAQTVWGKDYPYLKPVDSVGDLLCTDYISEPSFSQEDFTAAIGKLCTVTGEPAEYIGEVKRSDSGTVISIKICGSEVSGKQLKKTFSLRSANFDLAFAEGKFTFTVRGYGHGVGMSQQGANYMALQGSTFTEILAWYYTGCKLEKKV